MTAHGHVPTDRVRVKQRQVCPEASCEAICVTTVKERHAAKLDKEIFGLANTQCVDVSSHVKQMIASVSEAANEGPHDVASLHDDFDFFDDVSGHKLDHAKAKKARELEMDYFRSIGVYSKVTRTEALTNGCKVISTN